MGVRLPPLAFFGCGVKSRPLFDDTVRELFSLSDPAQIAGSKTPVVRLPKPALSAAASSRPVRTIPVGHDLAIDVYRNPKDPRVSFIYIVRVDPKRFPDLCHSQFSNIKIA